MDNIERLVGVSVSYKSQRGQEADSAFFTKKINFLAKELPRIKSDQLKALFAAEIIHTLKCFDLYDHYAEDIRYNLRAVGLDISNVALLLAKSYKSWREYVSIVTDTAMGLNSAERGFYRTLISEYVSQRFVKADFSKITWLNY